MYDIAGLRMMCQFVDDIDVVVDILRQRETLRLLKNEIIFIPKRVVIVLIMSSLEYPIETLNGQNIS